MDAEQVIGALASAVPLAAGIALAWPVNDARRQRRVTTWARTNLVPLSPGIARALDQSIHRRNRVAGVAVSIAAIGLSVLLATGWEALATAWALIVAMGIALTLAGVWQLQRDWFRPSHSRSARVREVTLDDYVPRPARLCAWTAGLLCLTASVASAIIEPSPDAAPITLGVGVLAAVAVAEWGGRRAASRPQPARDAAELYAQDAWRSEVARNGFQNIPRHGADAVPVVRRYRPASGVADRSVGADDRCVHSPADGDERSGLDQETLVAAVASRSVCGSRLGDTSMIRIDSTLAEPPYDQVKRQVAALVASGELAPGDKLPTVRRLAADLSLAPNTVARAYRELETAGVLDTRGRAGTFVTGDQTSRAARQAAAEYAQRVRALGLDAEEALALVRHSLAVEG